MNDPVRYPAPGFHTYYNVPPYVREIEDEEELEFPNYTLEWRSKQSPEGFFNTIAEPLPISGSEMASISILAGRSIRDYIQDQRIPRRDDLGNQIWWDMDEFLSYSGEAMGCSEPLDRTLLLPLSDSDLYSPQFIRLIQQEVLHEHPLWRLEVYVDAIGYEREHLVPLAIYPDAVVIGNEQYAAAQQEEQLRAWQSFCREVYDHTHGAQKRQLRLLESRLPHLVQRLASETVVLILAADNFNGERDLHTLWVLQPASEYVYKADEFPGLGCSLGYYVTPAGRLTHVYRQGQPWLFPQTVPAATTHQLVMRYHQEKARPWERRHDIKDQTAFVINVQPTDLVTDAEMKSDPLLSQPLNIEFRDDQPLY